MIREHTAIVPQGETRERRDEGCDGDFEEKLCKEVVACTRVAPGVAKRLGLAVAANPEKSTLARSDFIILQLNKTSFWRERVNEL